jgi:hypothetical protein
MGHVPRPCTSGGIKPAQRQDCEHRASHFVKQLLQYTPESAKTVPLRGWLRYAADCAHRNILAHNQERNVLPSAF